MPVKMKDGRMKVDLFTRFAFVQTLDKLKPDNKKKVEDIIKPFHSNFSVFTTPLMLSLSSHGSCVPFNIIIRRCETSRTTNVFS